MHEVREAWSGYAISLRDDDGTGEDPSALIALCADAAEEIPDNGSVKVRPVVRVNFKWSALVHTWDLESHAPHQVGIGDELLPAPRLRDSTTKFPAGARILVCVVPFKLRQPALDLFRHVTTPKTEETEKGTGYFSKSLENQPSPISASTEK